MMHTPSALFCGLDRYVGACPNRDFHCDPSRRSEISKRASRRPGPGTAAAPRAAALCR